MSARSSAHSALPSRTALLFALVAAFPLWAMAAPSQYELRKLMTGLVTTGGAASSGSTVAGSPPPTYTAQLSAAALTFDPTLVGSTQTKSTLVLNTGTGPLALVAPAVTGAGFSATTACGVTLAAGASCAATITFSPSVKGAVSGSVSIGSNSTGGSLVVSLTGTGTQATGALTPDSSSDFSSVMVASAASRVFTFTNTGNGVANGVYAAVTGAGLSFAANTCGTQSTPVVLAPAGTCSVTVQYQPSTVGTLTAAALSIASSADNGTRSISLTGAGIPSTFASVSVQMHMDGSNLTTSFPDVKGHAFTDQGGVVVSTAQSKFGGASAYFNGAANSYLSTPTTTDTLLGTGDYTMEAWIYRTDAQLASSQYSLFSDITYVTENGFDLQIYGNRLRLCAWNHCASNGVLAISNNAWHHIALSRTSGVTRVFVDGAQDSFDNNSNWNYTSTSNLQLGWNGYNQHFEGYMDEFRFTKGIGRYTAPFTVPAAPFTDY